MSQPMSTFAPSNKSSLVTKVYKVSFLFGISLILVPMDGNGSGVLAENENLPIRWKMSKNRY